MDFQHSWNPPPPLPPLLKGGGKTFQKLGHLGKVGEEGGGVDVEMWGLPLFYYFTVQLHLLYVCRKSKVSFITFRFFSLLS